MINVITVLGSSVTIHKVIQECSVAFNLCCVAIWIRMHRVFLKYTSIVRFSPNVDISSTTISLAQRHSRFVIKPRVTI